MIENDPFEDVAVNNIPQNRVIETVQNWDHLLGQQDLNQRLAEWADSTLPTGHVLGLFVLYLGVGRAITRLFSSVARSQLVINYNNNALIYRPTLSGPFILEPLNWLFTLLLWKWWFARGMLTNSSRVGNLKLFL